MTHLSGTSQDFLVKRSTTVRDEWAGSRRLEGAAVAPLIPAERPVTVLRQRQRRPAAVADLHHVTRHRIVVEPFRIVGIEVQATVGSVAVALSPHRRVELMQIYAVRTDL